LSAGFTNGCFDIVKLWAISSPSAVRAGCDKLVVALNAGASVRALKGPDASNQPAREIIAVICYFDCVLAFEECTPLEVLRCLVLHVLIKGADYAEESGDPSQSVKTSDLLHHLVRLALANPNVVVPQCLDHWISSIRARTG
jgi:bifunctional ADP-heptose synthase (sugar kinase/adenylyltransferase)